jgi:hypothetical protein
VAEWLRAKAKCQRPWTPSGLAISIYHDRGALSIVPLWLLTEGQTRCKFSGAEGSFEGIATPSGAITIGSQHNIIICWPYLFHNASLSCWYCDHYGCCKCDFYNIQSPVVILVPLAPHPPPLPLWGGCILGKKVFSGGIAGLPWRQFGQMMTTDMYKGGVYNLNCSLVNPLQLMLGLADAFIGG